MKVIKITEKQKRLLDKLKIHPRQPYQQVIEELLKPFELPTFTKEEREEFLKKIEQLRSTIRKRLEKRKGGEIA